MRLLPPPPLPDWIESQLPLIRYRVDLGAWRMHVMERGEGPTVFMLHGNPTWGFLYRKVVESLGPGFRVIVPDLVGLGLSDKPHHACQHTLVNHIDWIGALVDRLDLHDVTVVCQDWGGPISLGAFAARPERVTGLVVLNTVIGPPKPGFRSTAFHRFARAPILSDLAFRLAGFPQIHLGAVQGDGGTMAGAVGRAYRYPLRKVRDRRAPLAMARMVPDSLQHPSVRALRDVFEFVSGFDGPRAIVWGTEDPVLGRVLGHVRRTLGTDDVTEVAAGHFLQEEVPDEIAAAIRRVVAAR